MIYFVYVYYSQDIKFKRLKKFMNLINFLSKKYKGIIINNSSHNFEFMGADIISGSNKYHEFSAYQEGYEYLSKKYLLNDSDIILIANDTLFSNHYYTFPTRCYIKYLLGKSRQLGDFVIGEIDRANSLDFNSWISSYFFISNWSTLKKVTPFFTDMLLYRQIVSSTNPPEIQWGTYFSVSLQNLIQNWLDPKIKNSWYKERSMFFDEQHFNIKLFNIVNERLLSFKLLQNGAQLIDIRGILVMKLSRLFEVKIYIKLFKYFHG